MTRIGIVGGGPAATLHAEAVRMAPSLELVGVAARPGGPNAVATALGVEELALHDLGARCDAIVVAVPPAATGAVVSAIGPAVRAVLVESPVGRSVAEVLSLGDHATVMTGANLLHAPTVRRGLRAIAEMPAPHHLELRARGPRPGWGRHGTASYGGGVLLDPGARLLPVLLAAAASPVAGVAADLRLEGDLDTAARLTFTLVDGRRATATLEWSDHDASAQLEAADDSGVVVLDLLPRPALERDGEIVEPPTSREAALVSLGFVDQIRRLAAVARGEAAPWADLSTGVAAITVAMAAATSASAGGDTVIATDVATDTIPMELLGSTTFS